MKKQNNIIIKCFCLFLVLIIIIVVVNLFSHNSKKGEIQSSKEEIIEMQKNAEISKLANWKEEDRIEYYATMFLRAIEYGKYEEAYNLLNSEFKNNYFGTEKDFEEYLIKYFPKEISSEYTNIERIGDLYVLWVEIEDLEDKNRKFSINIVIKENDLDDFELSFSLDGAMK